jgi:hypothetical protein
MLTTNAELCFFVYGADNGRVIHQILLTHAAHKYFLW